MIKNLIAWLGIMVLFFTGVPISAQQTKKLDKEILSFDEYMGYVKKYHPLVSRAGLEVSKAQAALMQARGGFDPKIEVDFDKK